MKLDMGEGLSVGCTPPPTICQIPPPLYPPQVGGPPCIPSRIPPPPGGFFVCLGGLIPFAKCGYISEKILEKFLGKMGLHSCGSYDIELNVIWGHELKCVNVHVSLKCLFDFESMFRIIC